MAYTVQVKMYAQPNFCYQSISPPPPLPLVLAKPFTTSFTYSNLPFLLNLEQLFTCRTYISPASTFCSSLSEVSLEYKPCKTRSQFNEAAVEKCQWVGSEAIFGKCKKALNWQVYRSYCEYDMCSRNDANDNTPMCTMVSALAGACAGVGIEINWYENADLVKECHGKYKVAVLQLYIHLYIYTIIDFQHADNNIVSSLLVFIGAV